MLGLAVWTIPYLGTVRWRRGAGRRGNGACREVAPGGGLRGYQQGYLRLLVAHMSLQRADKGIVAAHNAPPLHAHCYMSSGVFVAGRQLAGAVHDRV